MKLTLSAVLTAVIATSSSAGSLETPAIADIPVVAAHSGAADWSGFYVGGLASFDQGEFNYFFPQSNPSFDLEGALYGGFAGYNHQRGNFVYGGEIAYSAGSVEVVTVPDYEFISILDVKARAGFATGRALIFLTAGGSFGPWTNRNEGDFGASGFAYGAGIDYQVTDRVFVGAEFLIRNLSGDFVPVNPNATFESSIQSIMVRAGIRF